MCVCLFQWISVCVVVNMCVFCCCERVCVFVFSDECVREMEREIVKSTCMIDVTFHTHTHTHRGAYEGPDLYASASALAAARPYVVSLRDLHIHFLHVGAVPLPHLGYALNGVMVGLAVCGSGVRHSIDSGPLITGTLSAAAGSLQGSVTCTDEQGNGRSSGEAPAAPVWPGMGVCVGVGLVRAVDMKRQELYVLTPTPEEQLEQVRSVDVCVCVTR